MSMHLMRKLGPICLLLGATSVAGCSSAGAGSGVKVGSECTSTEQQDRAKACSGSRVLECKQGTAGYAWEVESDCADSGETCEGGGCVARTPPRTNRSGGLSGDYSGTFNFGASSSFPFSFAVKECGTVVSGTLTVTDSQGTYGGELSGTAKGPAASGSFELENGTSGTWNGTGSADGSKFTGSWSNDAGQSGTLSASRAASSRNKYPCR